MRVLISGASSFTGLWFAYALHAAGHEVVAPLRSAAYEYTDVRGHRVRELVRFAKVLPGISFGDERFLELVRSGGFDCLCHHAATVEGYRNQDFDVVGALAANTRSIRRVMEAFAASGGQAFVATGSVFEPDAGLGETPHRGFSPYGVSKALSFEVMRYWAQAYGIPIGKFIIANPFGPFEEERFCAYLIRTWRDGQRAKVMTPGYVRDNMHVDLLAAHYAEFVVRISARRTDEIFGPMGYIETQGAFAARFAAAMRARMGWRCELDLPDQTEFPEPRLRTNTDVVAPPSGWSERSAWDRLAQYYADPAAFTLS